MTLIDVLDLLPCDRPTRATVHYWKNENSTAPVHITINSKNLSRRECRFLDKYGEYDVLEISPSATGLSIVLDIC